MPPKKKLKLESVLAGVSGIFPGPDPGKPLATPRAGRVFATREVADGLVTLTDQALIVLAPDETERARAEGGGATQLVVVGDKAVTLAADAFRVYRVSASAIELLAETPPKKPGPMWVKDARVFSCFGGKTWELVGVDQL